jgi:hypothetical protein
VAAALLQVGKIYICTFVFHCNPITATPSEQCYYPALTCSILFICCVLLVSLCSTHLQRTSPLHCLSSTTRRNTPHGFVPMSLTHLMRLRFLHQLLCAVHACNPHHRYTV